MRSAVTAIALACVLEFVATSPARADPIPVELTLNPALLPWGEFDFGMGLVVSDHWSLGPQLRYQNSTSAQSQYVISPGAEYSRSLNIDSRTVLAELRVNYFPAVSATGWLASAWVGAAVSHLTEGAFETNATAPVIGASVGYHWSFGPSLFFRPGAGVYWIPLPERSTLTDAQGGSETVAQPLARIRPWAEICLGVRW